MGPDSLRAVTRRFRDRRTAAPTRDLAVRRMQLADLPAAGVVSAAAFGIDISSESARQLWEDRVSYPLQSDPDGAFVAERSGEVIGVAQAMKRERLWCLSLLAVAPDVQGAGAGRALMERTLSYGRAADAGLIVSSNDSRALRLYVLSGFSLQPTFDAEGSIDRRALPPPDARVSEGDVGDLEAVAAISRDIRGAPHTAEAEFALRRGACLLRCQDQGFAIVQPSYGVWLLAARQVDAAKALLWSALGLAGENDRPSVRWITGAQDWAIDVVVRAGLRLTAAGALCVRGEPGPLHPFVPSGPFA